MVRIGKAFSVKKARKRCEQLYDRRLMTQKYEKIYIEKAAYEKGTSFHKR